MSSFDLGRRISDWQRQVSSLQSRLMQLQAIGQEHRLAGEVARLRSDITVRLGLYEKEWQAMKLPAPRRAQAMQACRRLLEALDQLDRSMPAPPRRA